MKIGGVSCLIGSLLAPWLMGCLAFSAALILFWGHEAAEKQRNKETEMPLNSFHLFLIC